MTVSSRAALWWGLPIVALAVLLGIETDWGRHPHRLPEPPPTIEPKPIVSALLPEYQVEGGLAGRAETVNRTLFNPTRRPAPAAAGDGGRRQMQRGQFVLTGTAVAGERHIAFLKEVAGGKSRVVRQGEQVNGILIADVRADRVKLTLGDESEELVLKVVPGPKTTVAAPTQPGNAPQPQPGISPQPGAPAVNAGNQPTPSGVQSVQEQRRRAAAAAAAAAQRAADDEATASPPTPPPGSAAPGPLPAIPATTPPTAPTSQPASPDPAWNEVYERMRQRSQPNK